jgi:hypothetical protein
MTKLQARQAWIRHIIKTRCDGNAAAFARAIGKDGSYVSRMLYPAGKSGRKGIGEDTVDIITAAFPDDPIPPDAALAGMQPDVQPTQIFTKERRASNDLLAVQIGLESLLVTALRRTPGAAGMFLDDVQQVAKGYRFSTKVGFLASLVGIAQEVQSEEEAAARVRRRAGSAPRTRREKPAQAG